MNQWAKVIRIYSKSDLHLTMRIRLFPALVVHGLQFQFITITIIILGIFYLQAASSPKTWGSKPNCSEEYSQKELQSKARWVRLNKDTV